MKQTMIELNNGVLIPQVGYGTFKVNDYQETVNAVQEAIKAGYRHIDTAMIYKNEEAVGEAIKLSGIDRKELFITSKVWNSDHGYEETLEAFDQTIKRLGVEYLDLYLIHWPKEKNVETWKALEALYKEGKIRAIGVSNFKIHHLEAILNEAEIVPVVNQVELHPQFPQDELQAFCKKHNIYLEAWGPIMQGQVDKLSILEPIAKKYNKSVVQVALRWSIQKGNIILPKSVTPSRIAANLDLFDFELTQEDMEFIKQLNTETRIGPDPDEITF